MKTTPSGRGLGWKRSRPDHLDGLLLYQPPLGIAQTLPRLVDLRPLMPPVYDQGSLGSCTGNGTAAIIGYDQLRQGLLPTEPPSRLMIYYLARKYEGDEAFDAGAQVRDAVKAAAVYGACFEDLWPYDVTRFAEQPPQACFDAALADQAIQPRPVAQVGQSLRACLATGNPVVFGFTCYPAIDEDEVARTGILPMPYPSAESIGGHCVVLVGYDDASRHYIVRNSWGAAWGEKGYFYMPYEYVERADLAADFWMFDRVG